MILTTQVEPYTSTLPNIIYANPLIVNKLGIPIYKPINLSFGTKKTDVFIEPYTNKGNLIRISAPIANLLHIPNGVKLHVKYNSKTGLTLGPILGILVQSIQDNQQKLPFGQLTNFAYDISKNTRKEGLCSYFFTLDNINLQTDCVNGFTLLNDEWERKEYPIPDVIYNRISSRSLEKKLLPKIKAIQKRYNFVFFNSSFLNKWKVYQLLDKTPIKNIMPETILYQGSKSIKYMLNKYPIIYLKPTNGALGMGIIKVEKTENGYKTQSSSVQSTIIKNFKNYIDTYKYLIPRISSKSYLIQKGLKLLSYKNRPIDFRILVQKNSLGKWAVTSMVARIAKDRYIVSNIAQGGTQSTVMQTIKLANPILAKNISRNHFKKNALLIARHIESSSPGQFAELGIDLALDNDGVFWLIEINSKPSKNDDSNTTSESRPSVSRLIQYTLFATNFKTAKK